MTPSTIFILIWILFMIFSLLYVQSRKKNEEIEKKHWTNLRKSLLSSDDDSQPVLWIYYPTEYNSRKWENFYSRSSTNLNQPYLELTMQTIFKHCNKSFRIIILEDSTFNYLLTPNYNSIDLSSYASPYKEYLRLLCIGRLLYLYGGLWCPLSFVCMKNLYSCIPINNYDFVVGDIFMNSIDYFFASRRNNFNVKNFCNYMSELISNDLGFEHQPIRNWLKKQYHVKWIDGQLLGTLTNIQKKPILIDDLLSTKPIDLSSNAYGIYVPWQQLLTRTNYMWFAYLSKEDILTSNTILGQYIRLSLQYNSKDMDKKNNYLQQIPILEWFKPKQPNWISWWKVPSNAPLWGLMPMGLGNNVPRQIWK